MKNNNVDYDIAKKITEQLSAKDGFFLQWEKSIELWISNWAQEIYISNSLKNWFYDKKRASIKGRENFFEAMILKTSEFSRCTVYVSLDGGMENKIGDAFADIDGKFFIFEVKKTLSCSEWKREALDLKTKKSEGANECENVNPDEDQNEESNEDSNEDPFEDPFENSNEDQNLEGDTDTDIDFEIDADKDTKTDNNIEEKVSGGKNRFKLLKSIKTDVRFKNHASCHFLVGINNKSKNIEATKYWNFIRNGNEAYKKSISKKALKFKYKLFSFDDLKKFGCNKTEMEDYVSCLLQIDSGWSGVVVAISKNSTTIANVNNAIKSQPKPKPKPQPQKINSSGPNF